MSDIDLELDGVKSLRGTIDTLEERWTTESVYVVGTDKEYGVTLEFGRGPIEAEDGSALRFEDASGNTIFRKRVSGHPPYPWFKPAVREFNANPEQFIRANTDFNSIDAIQSADKLVTTVAVALQTQMEKNASANTSSDRSAGTHPDHPQRDTGALVASIQATKTQ